MEQLEKQILDAFANEGFVAEMNEESLSIGSVVFDENDGVRFDVLISFDIRWKNTQSGVLFVFDKNNNSYKLIEDIGKLVSDVKKELFWDLNFHCR